MISIKLFNTTWIQTTEKYFISAAVPDIHDIQNIAKNNPGPNREFYQSLQVPYLTNALSSSTEEAS